MASENISGDARVLNSEQKRFNIPLIFSFLLVGQALAGQPTTVLHVPDDSWETWALTPGCGDALRLYEVRSDEKAVQRLMPAGSVAYQDRESFALISRTPGCAKVRLASGEAGFVASVLAYPTADEKRAVAAAAAAEKERRARAAKKAADLDAALEKSRRDREAWIAGTPVVNSGSEKTFVAADEKCAHDFGDAIRDGGLKGRKELADLISYGCGFVENSGFHAVQVGEPRGLYCRIDMVDPLTGTPRNDGWVQCDWIKVRR
jgi:hypothetical protein